MSDTTTPQLKLEFAIFEVVARLGAEKGLRFRSLDGAARFMRERASCPPSEKYHITEWQCFGTKSHFTQVVKRTGTITREGVVRWRRERRKER